MCTGAPTHTSKRIGNRNLKVSNCELTVGENIRQLTELKPANRGSFSQSKLCRWRNTKCCITLISTSSIRRPCRKRISSLSGLREAEAALGAKKAGVIVDLWKCVGTRRVMVVVNVDSPDVLDQIALDLPIMKEHGQHVQVDVTPLRRFEDFATDVKKRLG